MTLANNSRIDPCPAECDILVVGGGPAGSTAAIMLAERGYRVTVLEKSHHPRFHIGESLLPANLPLLERLGVAEKVRSVGMEKWGAEFVSHWDGRHQEFRFANAWDKSLPLAYQVRRSEFDEILHPRLDQLERHLPAHGLKLIGEPHLAHAALAQPPEQSISLGKQLTCAQAAGRIRAPALRSLCAAATAEIDPAFPHRPTTASRPRASGPDPRRKPRQEMDPAVPGRAAGRAAPVL